MSQALADAQALYNELYEVYMSESMWEQCAALRARYPHYEANRPKEDE